MPAQQGKITLRRFTPGDAEKIFRMSQEDTLAQFLPDQVYQNYEETCGVLEVLIQFSEEPFHPEKVPYVLGVLLNNNELIGHVGVSRIDEGLEIGYAIEKRYQGCGYATQAVLQMLHKLETTREVHEVYGIVDPDNEASQKVLEKCGFKKAENKSGKMVYKKYFPFVR